MKCEYDESETKRSRKVDQSEQVNKRKPGLRSQMSSTGNADHSHHQMDRVRTARETLAKPLWREEAKAALCNKM
ncbi:hypothetical protein CY34DRAFT_810263 [Suillus luteus UH-Slu-Lm8-n1]|uniref:Unplaced genomic scaffold CY34scaffold_315, whole genome shotgun sequence n=1 Tax=Suillus luteus UH-Slu-Lm8-n1 TaxID=930992 RepID=A0A0D0AHD5_9AGAM|nr:hypothetical protein CY34DRAFT_810263 [Suillus luteus UH-Slu-Lm8-n1]